MAGGHPNITEAWDAATATVAAACGVDLAGLRAPSRGRGPRPPRELWEPKQIAVCIAVTLADCAYSDLGREIGLHRDTVASHCAAIRAREATDEDFGNWVTSLTNMATGAPQLPIRTQSRRMARLEARLAELEGLLRRSSDTSATHPTAAHSHENVIKIARGGRR